MENLELLRQWLLSCPFWETGAQLYINFTDAVPGNCGLFPMGTEEVDRKADVLGNMQISYRSRFTFYRVAERSGDGDAHWMQRFENWVNVQDVLGLTPQFGDGRTCLRAENGHLLKARLPEKAMFAVELTAEFTKIYEVI